MFEKGIKRKFDIGLVPRKREKPELRQIPPMTVDGEEAYLVREIKQAPWKRMTRSEIEVQFPGAFDK